MPHHLDLPGAQDITTDPATGPEQAARPGAPPCILASGDRMHLGAERLREFITRILAEGS